jgi:hypothetical protein
MASTPKIKKYAFNGGARLVYILLCAQSSNNRRARHVCQNYIFGSDVKAIFDPNIIPPAIYLAIDTGMRWQEIPI